MAFLSLISLSAVIYLLIVKFKLKKALKEARDSNQILSNNISKLEAEGLDLQRFKTIVDVEKTTSEMLVKATDQVNEMERSAKLKLEYAEETKNKIVNEATVNAKELKARAESVLSTANQNAQKIVSDAEEEVKKIAGKAYDALQKYESLEKTTIAMKNIIEGYGDQYIVPTYSLIDKLAEDYSHTTAGEELKKIRDRVKSIVKSKTAASCDYVEDYRKQTAIDFVVDAFNGKVDTILSSVKFDNFGTLEQKIKDAYYTVNHNGVAFRNARINDFYLQARLEELKLACTVHALKEQEKEEQRRIREQIREEEKAAKEYEKAIKEAQKEEEVIAKAMDKVKKDLETANEQQRIKYEEKLKELEAKLLSAEEKNKRAISLAQQTKAGHVYIISNIGSFGDDVLKIGMTRRLDPMDRIWELGYASVPFDFEVHAMIYCDDAPSLEKELHRKFSESQMNKVNPRKEFFRVSIHALKEEVSKLGINAHWTMLAEAREYRESLKINTKSSPDEEAA